MIQNAIGPSPWILVLYMSLIVLCVSAIAYVCTRSDRPWDRTTPLSNDERYLLWTERMGAYTAQQMKNKALQRQRVDRILYIRDARGPGGVHVPKEKATDVATPN